MEKILRINVGADGGPKATETPLGDYAGLGGRAMTSAIVSKEVDPLCHPLGAGNKLVIAPGMLSGSAAAAVAARSFSIADSSFSAAAPPASGMVARAA
jgi:aldehyde:ferredoxin oxidoreductase